MSVYKDNSFHIRMNAQTDSEGKMLKKGNHNVPKAKKSLSFLVDFLKWRKWSVCPSAHPLIYNSVYLSVCPTLTEFSRHMNNVWTTFWCQNKGFKARYYWYKKSLELVTSSNGNSQETFWINCYSNLKLSLVKYKISYKNSQNIESCSYEV